MSIQLNTTHSVDKKKITTELDEQKQQESASDNGIIVAWLEILDTLNTQNHAAETQTKVLQTNSNGLAALINIQNQLNFAQIPSSAMYKEVHYVKGFNGLIPILGTRKEAKNVGNTTLNNLQNENEQVEKERNYYSNLILLSNQNSQVTQTELNTTTGAASQNQQMGASLPQMLQAITQKVCSISQ